ncbi:response regulator [Roseiflexus sp.]|uniref:hybrid sensor histidine kinase/response regulator n=1 Tax=Roseiflexus sp. TaxID=2562120 RepID=UPI00398ACF85
MDLASFYSQFRDETAENIRIVTEGLVALEGNGLEGEARRERIDAIFRAMHTIKGSARMLGFEAIGKIAHTCEHILAAVRDGRRTLDRFLTDELLKGSDAILELLAATIEGQPSSIDVETLTSRLGRGVPQPDPATDTPTLTPVEPQPPSVDEGASQPVPKGGRERTRQTVRVRVDRLDRLLNLAGELSIGRQIEEMHLQAMEELKGLLERQQRSLLTLESELRRVRLTPTQRETFDREMNGALNAGERADSIIRLQLERIGQHTMHKAQLIDDLEQEVMAIRLTPVATLYANLPRAVRELARDLGKEASLRLTGETTELDRKVIEALADPMVHLIRNALDHGIEPAEERERLGKPRQGMIDIAAQAHGGRVLISVHDDGRGMDPQHLREAAVRKGLISVDAAAALSDQEALELIFMPGFTTAKIITDVSGRGVGMDVVRTNLAEIGGEVQIESQPGAGTTIMLSLPLTLVTTRVLLVETGGQLFGFPASGCQGTVWVRRNQIRTVEGRAVFQHNQILTPLLRLDELLGIANGHPFASAARVPALLIGGARRPMALLIDRMVDEREAVIKPLGPLLEKQRRYSGALQLGDGRLALLLNPMFLTQLGRGTALVAHTPEQNQRRRARLLVVDDSFATRELIRSILSTAGYEVATAVDGLDALDRLRAEPYDLVVSDVEMPRVDGFTLTSRIRSELGKTDLPVIIVTSLASETHRRRGLEVGAQAYIVKSQFNQNNLLETIRQLIGM